MDRDLLVQALIVVVIANTLVIGLALAGGRLGGRRARAEPRRFAEPRRVSVPAGARAMPAATAAAPTNLAPSATGAGAPTPQGPPTAEATRSTEPVPVPRAAPAAVDPWDRFAGLVELEGPAGWRAAIEREGRRLLRGGMPLVVVALEAHGYRAVEERLGPAAGRAVAGSLARTVRELSRGADVVACVGPGAFRMLLLDTDRAGAIRYVERLAASADPWLEASGLDVRLAAGAAAVPGEADIGEAVRLAEQRMHEDGRRPELAA